MKMNMNINNVETMNNADVINTNVNTTEVKEVATMNIADTINNNGPVIDDGSDDNKMTLNERIRNRACKKIVTEKEETGNIFAIAFSGNKVSLATNVKDITNEIFEGENNYDTSLNIIYSILEHIKETSSYKKQMNTIVLWGSQLNDLVNDKNSFKSLEFKAIANEILKMKQELKDCVVFKKGEKGGQYTKEERTIKNAAWTLLGY